ncbi:lysozyme C-1-like [Bufo bufo]|uniref:lysozyme C-1-like n=1 Tax=Bufo bufo TaxID=8384 RepID=UPI001ABE949E|nr:lysozyme C-1-like [Bufo bufo]
MKAAFCLIFLTLFVASHAKVFTKCELAKALKTAGLDGYYGYSLANWMCMAYYESRYTTNAMYDNGWSRDYGVFQINSYWWCNDGKTSGAVGACSISCNNLMNDDISDDITCAKRVVRDPNGMGAWTWTPRRMPAKEGRKPAKEEDHHHRELAPSTWPMFDQKIQDQLLVDQSEEEMRY